MLRPSRELTTPRQQIFTELEKLLQRARDAIAGKLPENLIFEDLTDVMELARGTVRATKDYNINRELLLQICAFLVGTRFTFKILDTNWDGHGVLPTSEFQTLVGRLASQLDKRVPSGEHKIVNPFGGDRTTHTELRIQFGKHYKELGVSHAAQVFATA